MLVLPNPFTAESTGMRPKFDHVPLLLFQLRGNDPSNSAVNGEPMIMSEYLSSARFQVAMAEWLEAQSVRLVIKTKYGMSSMLIDHESHHITVFGQNCSHQPTP